MSVNPLTSLTEWVVHIFMICGTNPNMVNEAAAMPNIVHHIFFSLSIPLLSHNAMHFALGASRLARQSFSLGGSLQLSALNDLMT
jgi:hypothetical protein